MIYDMRLAKHLDAEIHAVPETDTADCRKCIQNCDFFFGKQIVIDMIGSADGLRRGFVIGQTQFIDKVFHVMYSPLCY